MDFERRDFEIEGIFFDGILRMTGFFPTGFWERLDFFRRDFENDGIFFDGILRKNGFWATGFWVEWISWDLSNFARFVQLCKICPTLQDLSDVPISRNVIVSKIAFKITSMKGIYFSKHKRELATLNIFDANLKRSTNSYQSVDKSSFQTCQPSLNSWSKRFWWIESLLKTKEDLLR